MSCVCACLVQLLFAMSCILLKAKRAVLKRQVFAKWYHIVCGMVLVLWGLLGTVIKAPNIFAFFVSEGSVPFSCA